MSTGYVFVEVGNTSVKVMSLDSPGSLSVERLFSLPFLKIKHEGKFGASLEDALIEFLGAGSAGFSRACKCVYSSVAPYLDDELIDFLKGRVCEEFIPVSEIFSPGTAVKYRWNSPMGYDRVLFMELLYRMGNESFVAVSLGSAVVIDVVVRSEHVAGFISPGISKMEEALKSISPVLSERLDNGSEVSFSPDDTSKAMSSGIYLPLYLLVERLCKIYSVRKVFFTGGDAREFICKLQRLLAALEVTYLEEASLRALPVVSGIVSLKP